MPVSSFVLAHAVPTVTWRTWTFEPGVVLSLAAFASMYALGLRRLWRTAGVGSGISRGQAAAFASGWLALVVALVSPLDALSDVLFAAHMAQHELLIVVAAPLIVLGAPAIAIMWLLPSARRKTVFETIRRRPVLAAWWTITAPATAWLLHAVALWVWHLPELYDAALEDGYVHAAQHISFFGTAALFWWGIAHGRYGRLAYGAAVLYVFATALHSGVLGALLTFSQTPWYSTYASADARPWGFTPLEDQQLAGLLMWVPAGAIFVVVGLFFFAAWLRESDRRVRLTRVASAILISFALLQGVACGGRATYRAAAAMTGGDPVRGQLAITKYGCDTCHTIPGIRTARALVGPPLGSVGARVYLAGHLPNTPTNMEQWIQHPRAHEPHTVMPEMGVTDLDARDIAAYLYTLR
jgi:putative membrane protein